MDGIAEGQERGSALASRQEQGRVARATWRHALVLGAYLLLTVGMTWPVAGNLGTHIPGHEGDAWVHLWTFGWIKDALLSGQSPFYTDALFYPSGGSLVFHNIAWVHFVLWLPLQAIVGMGAAYSLVFLANFVFNAFATYLLALDVTSRAGPAFVAGLIAGFWPYTMSHHSHPNLITIGWLALIILALRRLLARRDLRHALWLGIVVALAGLTRWQLLLIMAPAIAIYALYALLTTPGSRDRRTFALFALAAIVALVLVLPLATPLIVAQVTRAFPEDLFVEELGLSTDALAYVMPSRYQPLWGEAVFEAGYQEFIKNKVFTPFLGYTTLLLAIVGLASSWRKSLVWLIIALVYVALAVGPVLQVNGIEVATLPWAFIYDSSFMGVVRHPDRFNVVLAIPMALLAAIGASALLQRLDNRHVAAAVTVGLSLLIILEYAAVYPLLPLRVSPWYEAIAQDAGNFALLDIPMHARSFDENYMLYQMRHGKPMVGGHISRAPREAFTFIESVPLLDAIRGGDRWPPYLPDVSRQLGRLHDAGVRYLILHKKYLTNAQEDAWAAWLLQPPAYEDGDLIVYETEPPAPARDQVPSSLRLSADLPVGIVAADISPASTTPGGYVWLDLHWAGFERPGRDYRVCAQLEDDEAVVATDCHLLAPDWPTSQWSAGELVYDGHVLAVDPFAQPGVYNASVTLRADDDGTALAQANVGQVTVEAIERQFELTAEPGVPVAETWADMVQLVGYDLEQTAANLQLTLFWRALDRPDQSYKLFIHMRDPASGSIVAQEDVIPRNWAYPTDWWEAGEYVVDAIPLSVTAVPAGEYDLFIGWYDEATSARLPLTSRPDAGDELKLATVMLGE